MIDVHVHVNLDSLEIDQENFVNQLKAAGFEGAFVLSVPPAGFLEKKASFSPDVRLQNLMKWCAGQKGLYPFFWLNPMDSDARLQVEQALDAGVAGFKIICDRFYPSDPQAMKIYRLIAANNKPILFHSGILWDGKPSSRYNRPVEFEPLLEVNGLRFALAHIGWPWCDELVALYGKFLNAYSRNPEISSEMFIDTTPGTPALYRDDAMNKLFNIYSVTDNVLFGTDNRTSDYNPDWAMDWVLRDEKILNEFSVSDQTLENYFSNNAIRFINGKNEN